MKKFIGFLMIVALIGTTVGIYLIEPFTAVDGKQVAVVYKDSFTLEKFSASYSDDRDKFITISYPNEIKMNEDTKFVADTAEKGVKCIWEVSYEGNRMSFSKENELMVKFTQKGKYDIVVYAQKQDGQTIVTTLTYTTAKQE